jgi:hypothetical protein
VAGGPGLDFETLWFAKTPSERERWLRLTVKGGSGLLNSRPFRVLPVEGIVVE